MKNNQVRSGVFFTLLLLFFVTVLAGQQITGTLTGIVADSSGAVIPAAAVTMTNENSGDIRRTESNAEGYFTISGVMPGSIVISEFSDTTSASIASTP